MWYLNSSGHTTNLVYHHFKPDSNFLNFVQIKSHVSEKE